ALGEDIATYGVIEYRLPRDATVVLLADWGTGLGDARALLADAMRHEPDAVIHLGDIYYSGTPEECRLNVQEIFSRVFEELDMAPVPVFSIPGNHDYYSFGEGFFQLIDTMSGGDPAWQQQASYFCLRTEDDAWQLLGMDTGRQDYWPWSAADPRYDGPSLQPSEIEWHADKLSRQRFAGTAILLSHHQLFSQHSKISNRRRGWMNEHLLGIFEPWFPRVAAWFWGHEHNLALYQDGLYDLTKGRLVGCSAYEESTGETPYSPHSTEFARNVPYREPRVELGHSGDYYAHGYVLLELGDGAHATYFEYPSWGMEEPMQKPKGKPLEKESIRAPQPEPPGGDVVKFGDRLYLGHSMGDHMATFHKGRQYYPTLAATGAVRLELKGGIKTLRHGSTCQIRSTEEDLGKYSYLGAWSLKHDCYYYTKDYDERKQTWRVLKKSNLDDPEIRYGDEVYIQNVYFDGQRLAKDGHYLTTAKDVADCWVFAQGAPMDGGSEAGEVETTAPKEGVAASEMPEPV
ncbi:MAG: metallophosphoesterase, partial [Gemmatimonadota bacterium]